ncbi:hypothetical protein [Mucilaginibacter lappiensis]|uniref:Uncharacterized protein n=1 Tax=Mucilaginibacter lappiensis TaxID=354630 RepID=A0A1N7ETQ4_9SPHI|nr:hypothetical protein [Mucilaginibacter lappiensis]MBB6111984.1 hypothetical protein [Mucilaginibacter lappiensis]MBB6126497.1 hypothetical protein [Mucilaginibacter lappiensis]SIR91442.1 hypothetical protein SAMN05421821_11589 [Mucilaginibacter lappiensis]
MKTKHFLFTSALLMAVTLISCKKDKSDSNNSNNNNNGGNGGNAQVSYTINGGSFQNQLISFNANPKSTGNGVDASSGWIKLYIDDAPSDDADSKFALTLGFNKAGTGTAKVYDPITNATGNDKGAVVSFNLQLQQNGGSMVVGRSTDFPKTTPGTITITKFGPVGGTVEGTFEGTVMDIAGVKYTITGGHFSVTRTL